MAEPPLTDILTSSPAPTPPATTTIVHLIRHAQSNRNGDHPPLSALGEKQCDDLLSSFRKYAPHITQVLSSPVGRCMDTARFGLSRHIFPRLKIQRMPALAGGRGRRTALTERSEHPEVDEAWIEEQSPARTNGRDSIDFVMKFCAGGDLDSSDVTFRREVVIVTHGAQLTQLLGRDYRERDFPNARMRSYVINSNDPRSFRYLPTEEEVKQQRELQLTREALHKKDLVDAAKKVAEESLKQEIEQKCREEEDVYNNLPESTKTKLETTKSTTIVQHNQRLESIARRERQAAERRRLQQLRSARQAQIIQTFEENEEKKRKVEQEEREGRKRIFKQALAACMAGDSEPSGVDTNYEARAISRDEELLPTQNIIPVSARFDMEGLTTQAQWDLFWAPLRAKYIAENAAFDQFFQESYEKAPKT